MKYFVFPIVNGDSTGIALFPEAAPLESALNQIRDKSAMLARQGYWRDINGQQVKPEYVSFHVVSEKDCEQTP